MKLFLVIIGYESVGGVFSSREKAVEYINSLGFLKDEAKILMMNLNEGFKY